MSDVQFLLERCDEYGGATAAVSVGKRLTYAGLADLVRHWSGELDANGIVAGTVVALEGEFSPNAIALFLALTAARTIVIPYTDATAAGREEKDRIAGIEVVVAVDAEDRVRITRCNRSARHELYDELRRRDHPGLVLFSSGTSGEPKAAVHDFTFLVKKFRVRRTSLTTLTFLLFDHWGGLNTMLHVLSNGGTIVTVTDRSPDAVCQVIERERVELLPTTPTFLNLMLLSNAHRNHDLSSLRVITYGAEPMPESTLSRLNEAFPEVKLQQTYGLIEVGVLRSKSRHDGSLWVKLGGEGYQTRVVNGVLEIKTDSTILGYLNAPTPITPDGWFVTGDAVLQEGEYFRILGRKSELINVGGEKVYPAEVENVIQVFPGVAEATVYGEKSSLLGEIVCARVRPIGVVDADEFAAAVKRHCAERLERFKVPVRLDIVAEPQSGERFKKVRR